MVRSISDLVVPMVLTGIFLWGLAQEVDVFNTFLEGAAEGLKTAAAIAPALVCLLTVVSVFKTSGALDVLVHILSPGAEAAGIPPQVLPLALMRPVSGSGAMVLFRDLLQTCGPDSFIGRVASVLEGSSETTFYTIAVYYGATSVKDTRHTLTASLAADFTALVASTVAVRLFLGN